MARYFFNIRDGTTYEDVDGTECPTVGHARREAVRLAGHSLMNQPQLFWNGEEWSVDVLRKDRTLVLTLTFRAENIVPDEWVE